MALIPASSEDTIAAIATPGGTGGIGIVRVSGASSLEILQSMFRKQARSGESAGTPLFPFAPWRLEHGWILDKSAQPLDEVLAVFMPGPRTFSGEDTAEIQCHGGRAVLDAVLDSALSRGARPAEAGEFSRRAFLNGRLDLSQAEAVAEMIAAPTLEGVYLARNKLEGRLGAILRELRQGLDWLRARLCLAIDFPDDAEDYGESADSTSAQNAEFTLRLQELVKIIEELVNSYNRARIWREGALAALAGRVNVGKSSLLNALLGRRRALVSDVPGTTRDFIEENLNLRGLPVRLADTAGLRGAADAIEAAGMDLARDVFSAAQAILLVLEPDYRLLQTVAAANASEPPARLDAFIAGLPPEDSGILRQYGPPAQPGTEAAEHHLSSRSTGNKVILVFNKMDLHPDLFPHAGRLTTLEAALGLPCVAVSAKAGLGLDCLGQTMRSFLTERENRMDFSFQAAPNLRQSRKLEQVLEELAALRDEFAGQIPAELLSVRLDAASAHLADVLGESGAEEILDQVFSHFCIGK